MAKDKEININVNVKSNVDDTVSKTGALKEGLSDIGNTANKTSGIMQTFDKATGGLASGFSSLLGGLRAATVGMYELAGGIAATGIGLLIPIIALLVDYFKDFDPLIDAIEQSMAAMGAAVRVVEQALASLFSSTEDSGEAFSNLGDKMAKAAKDAADLKKAQQDLNDEMQVQEIRNAQANQQYAELILKSKNRTLSEKERLEALKAADKIESDNYKERERLVNKDLANAEKAAQIKGSLSDQEMAKLKEKGLAYAVYLLNQGKITQEEVDNLKKATLAKISILDEDTKKREKNQNAQDKIAEKAEADAEKRAEKAQAAAEKRAEKIRAIEEKRIQDRQKFLETIANLENKYLQDELTANAKTDQEKLDLQAQRDLNEILAIQKKGGDISNLMTQYNEKYTRLQDELDQKQKENADKKAADELQKKTKNLEDLLAKDTEKKTYADLADELEIDALNKKNQALLEAQMTADITKAQQLGATEEQIDGIKKFYLDKEVQDNKDAAGAKEKIEKLSQGQKDKALKSASNSLKTFSNVLGETTAAGKAMAIAATTIDTYQSAVSAYKSMSGIPVVGPALGVAAAAAAVASGISTVSKIISTKVPGKDVGGTVPSAIQSSTPAVPALALYGKNSNANEASAAKSVDASQNANITVTAVVSETEITSTQGKVAKMQKSAEL